MENFKKYYKFPLKADNMGVYVRTADYEMALMFCTILNDDIVKNIVDKLNGESNKSSLPEWSIKHDIEIYYDRTRVMLVRGWEMLHGKGNNCYSLPEEDVIKTQKEFAEYVVNTLNS